MVLQASVNYSAVLVSAVAGMILGALWYSPLLFGKLWMKLNKIGPKEIEKAKKKGMKKQYLWQFILLLVMAYVLAHFINYTESATISQGLQTGFWLWLGFVMPFSAGEMLWKGKAFKSYLLDDAHHLIALLIMGAILAVWA